MVLLRTAGWSERQRRILTTYFSYQIRTKQGVTKVKVLKLLLEINFEFCYSKIKQSLQSVLTST